ncbi:MAG TPA: FKBP-type peptidyl-prolyl cis-trans isomerase [Verrucomicrobiae bacterium]|nr:FKBP-type peptidyl-prolyl cis-trans isomerase [Verrucomicrobiae bacterium]
MKSGLKQVVCLSLAVTALQFVTRADEAPSTSTNSTEELSYSIGMSIGNSLKQGGYEVDPKVVGEAIKDVLSGAPTKLTDKQAQETISKFRQEQQAKREQDRAQLAEKNHAEAEKFFAENKEKEGVKVESVKQGDATVELQYKVLTEGSGNSPKAQDTVTFNYNATTLDGKEIDSTSRRGQPVKTVLNQYPIAGVKEALQLMKPGAKWQVFIPPALAFGDRGAGQNVEPGSALIFELELVGFDEPQPLTSDIIKVPSKEELDRGAKIEVIKPEDVKRMQETNAAGKK